MLRILAFTVAAAVICQGREIPSSEILQFDPTKVHFWLWTRQNPSEYQELFIDDIEGLKNSNFDASLPTRIAAHGFGGNAMDGFNLGSRDEFLAREPCNFIGIDWSALSTSPNYVTAVAHVKPTGERAGDFVHFLMANGLSLDRIHVIGYSLGSHVAGHIGRQMRVTYATLLPRVTGLDPALPEFSLENTDGRIDTTDGEFVDIIHTNSGTLLEGGLSFKSAIGHVDFYPNGGSFQPGCPHTGIGLIDDMLTSCNHGRAPQYFIESINTATGFLGTLCDSYENFEAGACAGQETQLMGEHVPSTARGVFYLKTNSESPFALG